MKKTKLKSWMVKKLTACVLYAITYTFVICIGGCLIYNHLVIEKLKDRVTALEEILLEIYEDDTPDTTLDNTINDVLDKVDKELR